MRERSLGRALLERAWRAPAAVVLLAAGVVLAGAPAAMAKPHPKPFHFAPYVDLADYPPPDLGAIAGDGGVEHISLGFVTARKGTACKPTWGGYSDYPAYGKHPYQLSQVRSLRRGGGDVVVSFGGQAGTELAAACKSVRALSKAYRRAIKAYGADHIDFDVEGAIAGDSAANKRRAKAIARLQRGKPGRRLQVSYTLAVEPDGLGAEGRSIVRGAVAKGVSVGVVNGMAMDYGSGSAPSPQGKMGDYAISVAEGMARQLGAIYPQLSDAKVARKIGITPMIGINDVPEEIFTLADAQKLADYASGAHIGMIGMWQLSRDRQCDHPSSETQLDCSGVEQDPWEFSKTLGAFGG
jgi:hypothetical protein